MPLNPKQLEKWRADAKESGMSEAEVEEGLAKMVSDDAKLDRCECLKCGGKLTRTLDPRQDGDAFGHGEWFNYNCAACGFHVDRAEGAN